jgi:hypothetical protein
MPACRDANDSMPVEHDPRQRVDAWLRDASADADRRGLPELAPLLETLARSTLALREAERRVIGSGPRYPSRP